MNDHEDAFVTEDTWEEFWANLLPVWRRVLCDSDTPTPPPARPILRRRRLTSDFEPVWTFEPIRWLPAVTEALLWDENALDLRPLSGRSWHLLQLAGPAHADLKPLRGTRIRQLILSNVDVEDLSMLRDVVGLKSLTLAHGDFGPLPPLEHLTELILHADVDVKLAECGPGLRVIDVDEPYVPPFGPNDV